MLRATWGVARIELVDREHRDPGPERSSSRSRYTGICGTDLHIVHGAMDARVETPAVLGHEMSGVVAALGDGVAGWAVGDRVTVMPLDWCGDCPACLAGHTHVCHALNFIGIDSPGSMQARWTVPARTLVALPDEISLLTAALAEPTAVAVHDVRRAELDGRASRSLVVGGGPIGLLVAMRRPCTTAPRCSCSSRARVAASSLDRSISNASTRREATSRRWIDDWTAGAGVPVGFEVSGAVAGLETADPVARRTRTSSSSSRSIRNAAAGRPLSRLLARADAHRRARLRALRLRGGGAAPARPGTIPAEQLITSVVPLDRVAAAFEDARERSRDEDPDRLRRSDDRGPAFDLTGQARVVTGCAAGIGLAMAEALAHAGADIVGVSAQLEPEGSEAQRRVEAAGRTFTGHRVDFSQRDDVAELRARARQRRQARSTSSSTTRARSRARPPSSTTTTRGTTVLQVNLSAPFALTREIGRTMVERGTGKVIFTASLLSFQGGINVPSYTASKSGIAGLVRALSNEWAPHGVNVNAIAPGYIATDNTEALRADPDRSRRSSSGSRPAAGARRATWPGPRSSSRRAASDYVYGASIPVDGGWLAR